MHSYPVNSPQAAARIVALTLLADGHIGKAELELLDRLAAHEQLGLERSALHALLDSCCADLLPGGPFQGTEACPVDERTLDALMGEVQDPALRLKVLRLCVQLAEVDAQVHDGESIVLTTAVQHWGLAHEMFRTSPPGT